MSMNEKEIISKYFRELQKKGVATRLKNDPNTYKKMVNSRWEKSKEGDLKIEIE